MAPEISAWLANIRAEAKHPDFFAFAVSGSAGTVLIYREDIEGRTDEQLLTFIVARSEANC